jgi:hypothetical protein
LENKKLRTVSEDVEKKFQIHKDKFREVLVKFLRETSEREREEDKKRVNEKSITIGNITYQKGLDVYEVWQDGTNFQQLKDKYNQICSEKERLEKLKKYLQKQRQQFRKEYPNLLQLNDSDSQRMLQQQINDINEQEETCKIKLNHLKKEESQNIAEQEKLLIEKSIQIREIKRIRDQDRSMFKNYPIIDDEVSVEENNKNEIEIKFNNLPIELTKNDIEIKINNNKNKNQLYDELLIHAEKSINNQQSNHDNNSEGSNSNNNNNNNNEKKGNDEIEMKETKFYQFTKRYQFPKQMIKLDEINASLLLDNNNNKNSGNTLLLKIPKYHPHHFIHHSIRNGKSKEVKEPNLRIKVN